MGAIFSAATRENVKEVVDEELSQLQIGKNNSGKINELSKKITNQLLILKEQLAKNNREEVERIAEQMDRLLEENRSNFSDPEQTDRYKELEAKLQNAMRRANSTQKNLNQTKKNRNTKEAERKAAILARNAAQTAQKDANAARIKAEQAAKEAKAAQNAAYLASGEEKKRLEANGAAAKARADAAEQRAKEAEELQAQWQEWGEDQERQKQEAEKAKADVDAALEDAKEAAAAAATASGEEKARLLAQAKQFQDLASMTQKRVSQLEAIGKDQETKLKALQAAKDKADEAAIAAEKARKEAEAASGSNRAALEAKAKALEEQAKAAEAKRLEAEAKAKTADELAAAKEKQIEEEKKKSEAYAKSLADQKRIEEDLRKALSNASSGSSRNKAAAEQQVRNLQRQLNSAKKTADLEKASLQAMVTNQGRSLQQYQTALQNVETKRVAAEKALQQEKNLQKYLKLAHNNARANLERRLSVAQAKRQEAERAAAEADSRAKSAYAQGQKNLANSLVRGLQPQPVLPQPQPQPQPVPKVNNRPISLDSEPSNSLRREDPESFRPYIDRILPGSKFCRTHPARTPWYHFCEDIERYHKARRGGVRMKTRKQHRLKKESKRFTRSRTH